VSKYNAALSGFFRRRETPANLPQLIQEGGGIEALARASASQRTAFDEDYFFLKFAKSPRVSPLGKPEVGTKVVISGRLAEVDGNVYLLRPVSMLKIKEWPGQ
jgi:hypothetical protein